MITMTAQPQHRYLSYAPASPQVVVVTRRKYTPTTRIEHLLLLLHIGLLPWEEALPGLGSYSFIFLPTIWKHYQGLEPASFSCKLCFHLT
jgi:hypothetical protein